MSESESLTSYAVRVGSEVICEAWEVVATTVVRPHCTGRPEAGAEAGMGVVWFPNSWNVVVAPGTEEGRGRGCVSAVCVGSDMPT